MSERASVAKRGVAKGLSTFVLLVLTLSFAAQGATAQSSASFVPPHFDLGVDTDGDTLFNVLRLQINVTSSTAGNYYLFVDLKDNTNSSVIASTFATHPVNGPTTLTVDFQGYEIRGAGFDGPYNANLQLFDEFLIEPQAYDEHLTRSYRASDFDLPPARFQPPHSDRGIDRDPPDGEFNVLEVVTQVDVTDPGYYFVGGLLTDATGTLSVSDNALALLSPGVHSVSLNFSGVPIRSSGIPGPYFVGLALSVTQPFPSFPVTIDEGFHGTGPYAATDFESTIPADLTGTIRDETGVGIGSGFVEAYNYLDNLVVWNRTDPAGRYRLPLYSGEWVVAYDSLPPIGAPQHQSDLLRVSLSGSSIQDVNLGPEGAIVNSVDLSFSSWESAEVDIRSVAGIDSATFRLLFDWTLGDQDQFLSQQEFDTFLAAFGVQPGPEPDSRTAFLVDEIYYDLVPDSVTLSFVNLTGSIDSDVAPEFELGASYLSHMPIPARGAHEVRLNVPYDTEILDRATSIFTVRLPSPFELRSSEASPDVIVEGLGTGTATVDPLSDPNPFDGMPTEWVSLDVATGPDPPTVTGTTDSPDPVELGEAVTISAQVNDDHGVESVKVAIRDSSGDEQVFDMVSSGSTYSYHFTPEARGSYTYRVTATDTAGNNATADGSFSVVDTTDPSADAGPAQTVTAGTVVTFDGTGSTDLDEIVSYTWTFDDDGPKTLTGPQPTYRFDRAGTYTVTLTVEDASGNRGTATVEITVTATTVSGGLLPFGIEWVAILGVIGVAAIVFAVLGVRRRGRKRP